MQNKKIIEKYHTQYFLNSYLGANYGSLHNYECPDFILNRNNFKIGIEVTQLYSSETDGIYSVQAQENWQNKVIDRCNNEFKSDYTIYISFEQNSKITKANVDQISGEIIDKVKMSIAKREPSVQKPIDIFKGHISNFQDSLFMISIYKHAVNPMCGFQKMNISSTPPINIPNIYQAINKKESLLTKYRKCDQIWLLMVIHYFDHASDQMLPGKIELDLPDSKFNKIFIYKSIENITRVLK
jgi:hypothetical protein